MCIRDRTVYENIAFAMHVTNVKSREISDRVEYMLELVHLEDKACLLYTSRCV